MTGLADILRKILAHKAQEVAAARAREPLTSMMRRAVEAESCRGFCQRLDTCVAETGVGVIAEIKRASPSSGLMRAEFDPVAIAVSYQEAGAACLSVLTDREFFQGHDDFLVRARNACALPVLRKDFIMDPWQVFQTRSLGADCILLIVAALSDGQLNELFCAARESAMDVLVEVHDARELERALQLDARLIGINNRDLRSFHTDLDTTLNLLAQVPDSCSLVTESGITEPTHVRRMLNHGVQRFLVGEAFMRNDDPGAALGELFYGHR